MKRPKKLTREQKEILTSHGMFPEHWLLCEEMEFYFKLIHKETGKIRFEDKFRRYERGKRA